MLFEDSMFDDWLDSEAKRVYEKFKTGDNLTSEDKTILVLKSQANHFHHLDIELKGQLDDFKKDVDQKFEKIDQKFEKIDQKFEKIDQKFEKIDQKFEKINEQLIKMHNAINMQTWKMIGAIGLIAVFIKLADNLPLIIEFFKK